MNSIIICDDEIDIRKLFKEALDDEGYSVYTASNSDELFKLLKLYSISMIFLDIILQDENGIDILGKIKTLYPEIEVIIITGHGSFDLAVKATKLGAFDFISKPIKLDYILQSVKKLSYITDLKSENLRLRHKNFLPDDLIGNSDIMNQVKDMVKMISQSDTKVLIYGENGTGKELIARLIHLNSSRASNNFVEINCAAIPQNLIESELFGYEKGAFTHATSQKKGKFEYAHKGTLFLDEIGDMAIDTQVKLLRAIQDGKFTRVGGLEVVETDVRIIAATNKKLENEIKKGLFREDLYYRLNVIPITLPPLRERKEDIPILIEYFMNKLKEKNDLRIQDFDKQAVEILQNFNWPGNIRQLKNIVERVNILSQNKMVSKELIESIINPDGILKVDDSFSPLKDLREEFEKKIIISRLKKHNWSITKTADSLEIERTNLYKKLKKYDIQVDDD